MPSTNIAKQTVNKMNTALEPYIIPPEQHPITESLIDHDALFVLRKLNKAGFSSYLVGGGVRDLYLGNAPKDFDICTDARPGQIRKLFPNSNTIGRRFRLVQLFFRNGKIIEIATLRSLSEHDMDGPEAVLAPNNTFGSLDQDAQRRDLTINSLFYEIENHTIIDYVGGVEDLDNCVVKIVGDPEKRINRDPVRMLRAIRHSARNNFAIEEKSWQAICDSPAKLTLCPPSRLRDELFKDLYGGVSARWFALAFDSGLFLELLQLYKDEVFTSSENASSYQQQLASIFTVIDRVNNYLTQNNLSRPKDYFLLALLLIPWAEAKHNLSKVAMKGPDRFNLSKRLRADIDSDIAQQLNLRKSMRQEMVTLLINLPSFINYNKNGSSPKWLKKKSYFPKCSLFYSYYQEAFDDHPIPDEFLNKNAPSKEPTGQHHEPRRKTNRKKRGPAFTSQNRGSIFGLKKR